MVWGWGGGAKCNRDKRYALHGPEDMAPTALPGLSPLREAEGLEGRLGVQGLGAPGMGGADPGGRVQSIGEAPSLGLLALALCCVFSRSTERAYHL